jgi:LmbE family N-acetylglucosaminyl deacetylase
MTAGDLGSATRSRAQISRIRKREAAASAKVLGAGYTCLGFQDLTIVYGPAAKRRVSALVRLVRPDLVIAPSPVDYMADHFGRRVAAQYAVDVTDAIELKERMLACHESQRAWLRDQQGEDEYLAWMRRMGAERARDFGDPRVRYAEGFRQHLGHGFPRKDHLTAALGSPRVKRLRAKED